jgi:hypothetical protein
MESFVAVDSSNALWLVVEMQNFCTSAAWIILQHSSAVCSRSTLHRGRVSCKTHPR